MSDTMENDPAYQKYLKKAINRGDPDPEASAKSDWEDDRSEDPDHTTDPAILGPAITEALGGLGGAQIQRITYTRTTPPNTASKPTGAPSNSDPPPGGHCPGAKCGQRSPTSHTAYPPTCTTQTATAPLT